MLIGDTVVYDGRMHEVTGFTPVSVTPAQVELRPLRGGATLWVDRERVTSAGAPRRAPLRLYRPTAGDSDA
jgi:hypothetical protein